MTALLAVPHTQPDRVAVLEKTLQLAVVYGLPVPSIEFQEFTRGFKVALTLSPGDRAAVERWARILELPAAEVLPVDRLYVSERHAPGLDLWCGSCWVLVSCELTLAGGA